MKVCTVKRRFYTSEGTAGGAVTINTVPGFGVPKACMVYFIESNAAPDVFDSSTQFRTLGLGLAGPLGDGTTAISSRVMNVTMMDNFAATGTTARRRGMLINNRFIISGNTLGALTWQATSPAFSTDAMTINLTALTPYAPLDCIFTFFGGNDLTVGVGDTSFATTAGGTRAYSALNFQPDLVLIGSVINIAGGGLTDDVRFSYGSATRSPLVQKGVYFHEEFSGGNVDSATLASSNAIISYSTATNNTFTHTIGSITTGGWTMTSSAAAGGNNNSYIYLALQSNPLHYTLTDFISFTGTGNSFSGAGLSFVPRIVLGASVGASTDNAMSTAGPYSEYINLFSGARSANSLYFDGIGTIQTNSAGIIVTGSGTQFFRLMPGDVLYQQDGTLIGTINAVGTATSLSLTSNAANTLSAGTSFVVSNSGQASLLYGIQDGTANQQIISSISNAFWKSLSSASGAGATLDLAYLNNFDTRDGYELNYITNSGTSKRGFVITFQDEDANRRRGGTF